jgi:hypothetical protein
MNANTMEQATKLAMQLLQRPIEKLDDDLLITRICVSLFEEKLEEAYDHAQLIADESLRHELMLQIHWLLPEAVEPGTYIVGQFYRNEVRVFSTWLMGKELDERQSVIREWILHELWRNTPPLAYRWAELLDDKQLAAKVEGAIRLLVEAYCVG